MTAWALTIEDWEQDPDVTQIEAHASAESGDCANDALALHTLGRLLHLGPATLAGSRTPLPSGGYHVSLSVFAHVAGSAAPAVSLAATVLDTILAGPDQTAIEQQDRSVITREAPDAV